MKTRRLVAPFADQRGVALPMALMALVIMTALVVAFSVLASTEPTIANNQLRVAQARALAEAGVEGALWALTAGKTIIPAPTGAIVYPMPAPVPAPYNGSALVAVSVGGAQIGGFRVTVTPGASQNERNVVAVGWVPTDVGSDNRTKAHRRITATLMDFNFNPLNMPCALCVRGDIQLGGNAEIDSKSDRSCGDKFGTWSTRVVAPDGTVVSPGTTTIASGAASIWGADGNATANQTTDMAVGQDQAAFDSNKMTDADLNALKAFAKSRGTYYQGAVDFNASNKIPNGIIFIDTVSGNNITPTTPSSDFAAVEIRGNAPADPSGIFNGWVIVNGGLRIDGNVKLSGMIYAVNDVQYTGTGTGEIVGQVISANVRDTVATVIDTSLVGNSAITYNCSAARAGGGFVPQNFVLKAGTYREVSD